MEKILEISLEYYKYTIFEILSARDLISWYPDKN